MKRRKGRKTEKQTANVQMPRTVGVVFGLSILFTIIPQFVATLCPQFEQNLPLPLHVCPQFEQNMLLRPNKMAGRRQLPKMHFQIYRSSLLRLYRILGVCFFNPEWVFWIRSARFEFGVCVFFEFGVCVFWIGSEDQEFGVRFRIRSVVWNSECTCGLPSYYSSPDRDKTRYMIG